MKLDDVAGHQMLSEISYGILQMNCWQLDCGIDTDSNIRETHMFTYIDITLCKCVCEYAGSGAGACWCWCLCVCVCLCVCAHFQAPGLANQTAGTVCLCSSVRRLWHPLGQCQAAALAGSKQLYKHECRRLLG